MRTVSNDSIQGTVSRSKP